MSLSLSYAQIKHATDSVLWLIGCGHDGIFSKPPRMRAASLVLENLFFPTDFRAQERLHDTKIPDFWEFCVVRLPCYRPLIGSMLNSNEIFRSTRVVLIEKEEPLIVKSFLVDQILVKY